VRKSHLVSFFFHSRIENKGSVFLCWRILAFSLDLSLLLTALLSIPNNYCSTGKGLACTGSALGLSFNE